MDYILLFLTMILVNNFDLAKFLGICPFIGVSKKRSQAVGMGFAVIFVMSMASAVTWVVYHYFLAPLPSNVFYMFFGGNVSNYNFTFLTTIVFILVIATLVQLVEMFLMKVIPPLYEALGIYLPLITTNCAVLGVALLNIKAFGYMRGGLSSFLHTVVQGFGSGVGFLLVLFLMSGIREKLAISTELPKALRGAPIAFICAALMALAFMGFAGLV